MDTLQIAYKILYSLEHKEKADYMGQLVSPAALDVPEDKWLDVLQALQDDGCVSGAKFSKDVLGNHYANIQNLRITLKGAEFLSENSTMQKIAKVATDVISILRP